MIKINFFFMFLCFYVCNCNCLCLMHISYIFFLFKKIEFLAERCFFVFLFVFFCFIYSLIAKINFH